MAIITTEHHTIIQKHIILLLFRFAKFFLLLCMIFFFWLIAFTYKDKIVAENVSILRFVIVPSLFFMTNYVFFKLILGIVIYFHDLVIFYKDKIVIIKNSLFIQSDMEIIDMYRVMKTNITCHGFIANFFGYGNITIEQQNDDVKVIHFVPRPEKIAELLDARRSLIINARIGKEKDRPKNYWDRS